MSFSQVIRADWKSEGREIAAAFTESASSKASFDENIPSDATNKEYAFSFDITKLKSLYMLSSEDLNLKTNSSGAPDDEILLVKDLPLVWVAAGINYYYASPVLTDVTKLFITNSSGVIVRLQIEVLFDPEV